MANWWLRLWLAFVGWMISLEYLQEQSTTNFNPATYWLTIDRCLDSSLNLMGLGYLSDVWHRRSKGTFWWDEFNAIPSNFHPHCLATAFPKTLGVRPKMIIEQVKTDFEMNLLLSIELNLAPVPLVGLKRTPSFKWFFPASKITQQGCSSLVKTSQISRRDFLWRKVGV